MQYKVDLNADSIKVDSHVSLENTVRSLVEMRMQLIPYLYAAFYDYYLWGILPFRALVSDYSYDQGCFAVSDQFLIGRELMAAPVIDNGSVREVYFPEGEWYELYTHEKYIGNRTDTIELPLYRLPLFVKSGAILPLAKPVQQISGTTQFELECLVFGVSPRSFTLYEDDGLTFDYLKGEWSTMVLSIDRKGEGQVKKNGSRWNRYRIQNWTFVE